MTPKQAHEQVEILYARCVSHIHADLLHQFIDDQQKEIEELKEYKWMYEELEK